MEQLDPVDVLGESFTYTIEGKKDTIILLSIFYSALDGEFAHEELLDELEAKESGQATWEIQEETSPSDCIQRAAGKALVWRSSQTTTSSSPSCCRRKSTGLRRGGSKS